MAKKRDSDPKDRKLQGEKAVSRRDFVKKGAAGVSAAVLSTSGTALAQVSPTQAIQWNYEADIVIIGGGCTGLPAAIRARDLGASVIVVDQNFDLGGKMLHSGGQGFFRERDLHRAYADNCSATREFLMANYVRFGRIFGTHGNGGLSRARRAVTFLMEGPTTDIKKGTITKKDAGIPGVSSSHFAPRVMEDGSFVASKGARSNGAALSRCLEFSAREKGVRFLLNRHMDEIIREQQFSGRVVGIRASYSPRFDPETGRRLESLWQNGNVDDRTETIYIRARKAIIIGAGGHGANPQFRSMFYPGWREPAFVSSGWALLGPRGQGHQPS